MFSNVFSTTDVLPEGTTLAAIADMGYTPGAEWTEEAFPRGSIVDVVVAGRAYEVKRIVLGNVTLDDYETAAELCLRWPDVFREEYMTAIAIKMVKPPAASDEEAIVELVEALKGAGVNLNDEQSEIVRLHVESIRARAAVSSVDWNSSSMYC